MKEQFTKEFASLRNTDPAAFWEKVCEEVGQEWRTVYSDEWAMFVATRLLRDFIHDAWKKDHNSFPLHAKHDVSLPNSALRLEIHHFADKYDDIAKPECYPFIAYIPMESDTLYPCILSVDPLENLCFDIFSPHCMSDYSIRMWGGQFSPKNTPERKKEEKIFSRHNSVKWADHFFFHNPIARTCLNKGVLSLAEQQKENKTRVSLWDEGITYCEQFNNHIVLHKSFVPYISMFGKPVLLKEDQLRSILSFLLEQAWSTDEQATGINV